MLRRSHGTEAELYGKIVGRGKAARRKLHQTMQRYREAYHGIYDVDENGNEIWNDTVQEMILQEILADAYAGKDTFAQGVEEYADIARDAASQIESWSGEVRGPPEGELNYLNTPGEVAAFAALPRVLKRGIEIGRHENHKGRDHGTVTFAAPVTINGKTGNMAVVVKQTSDNFYKTHRILTPDGNLFELQETPNAEPTPAGESLLSSSLATPIGSAFEDNVPQEKNTVKSDESLSTNQTEQKNGKVFPV